MKHLLYTLFASLLICLTFAACSDDDETPAPKPNIIKTYLTKDDFKGRLIPAGNGAMRKWIK